MTRVVLAGPEAPPFAEALAAAGVEVQTQTANQARSPFFQDLQGAVLWGAGVRAADALVAAAAGGAAGVIALAPAGLTPLARARDVEAVRRAVRVAPLRAAKALRVPVLVQVADEDTIAPPQDAMDAAWAARAIVHHYPCDHDGVLAGGAWFDAAVRHQLAFLRRL